MVARLPLSAGDYTIRQWQRADVDFLAAWPTYPSGYEGFNLAVRGLPPEGKDGYFSARQANPHRTTLVVDHRDQAVVGYIALVEIDWDSRVIGNMGIRIAPAWCDRGIGTLAIGATAGWCFASGFESVRLDVAGANTRAVRCYEKAGFASVGEFWRDDKGLLGIDLSDPRHAALRAHFRMQAGIPQVRFWWMEARNSGTPSGQSSR
jgi:RimJ/RimL family protein N-acetyltransferase